MGRLLTQDFFARLRTYDPSLDVVWNGRLSRYVVVQKLEQPTPVNEMLRGSAAAPGEFSRLKGLIVCEIDPPGKTLPFGQGIPLTPNVSLIRREIEQNYPRRGDQIERHPGPGGNKLHRAEALAQAAKKAALQATAHRIAEETAIDRDRYAKRELRHFIFSSMEGSAVHATRPAPIVESVS